MWTRSPSMVGRESEVAELTRILHGSRSGAGRAVFVLGEPGVGKSRMAVEVATAAASAGMRVLRGRGTTIGPIVPFRPLTEALLSHLRVHGAPDFPELGPYRAALNQLAPGWDADPGQGDRSLVILAEAVLRLLSAVGRRCGCLLVLEDLHDYDTETLAVVEYLTDNLDGQPAMLLATSRMEPGQAFDLVRAAARRDPGGYLELGRFGRAEAEQIMAGCLDTDPAGLPASVVDELWQSSSGVPFVIEELLHGMINGGVLVRDGTRWLVAPGARAEFPNNLARSFAARTERLGPHGRLVLGAAAVLGRRFPVDVVRKVTGLGMDAVLQHLDSAVVAQLVAVEPTAAGWYCFQHPLTVDALLAQLSSGERTDLSGRAAAAVSELHATLPGAWCQQVAVLHLEAGDTGAAAELFAEAGRRALTDGAAGSAVVLLDRAERLLAGTADASGHADVLESLLFALAESGQLDRALDIVDSTTNPRFTGLDPARRVALHVQFAWVAAAGGRMVEAMAQVAAARATLGADPAPVAIAPVDAVAALLTLECPGSDRIRQAEVLARRAVAAAQEGNLPAVACQALQIVGMVTLSRDADEARSCYQQAQAVADEHGLPIPSLYSEVRLSTMDWLFDASTVTTERAYERALRAGAIAVACNVDAVLALDLVLTGDFVAATARLERCRADAIRLRMGDLACYVWAVAAVLAGHQGRRQDMEAALEEFDRLGGSESQAMPMTIGLARTFCALLEDDHPRALDETRSLRRGELENPTTFHLAGTNGLHLLLDVLGELDGDTGRRRHAEVAATPGGRMRWNQQFVLLADAVLLGRAGRPRDAEAGFTRAQEVAEPYPLARALGARLVAPAAIADGWGTPVRWLRTSEDYFYRHGMYAAAGGCRTLLRRAGVSISQRRVGVDRVPAPLRALGVTVREFEVMELLADHLPNKSIAAALHISARTVEKHVASLIAKTGRAERHAVGRFAMQLRRNLPAG